MMKCKQSLIRGQKHVMKPAILVKDSRVNFKKNFLSFLLILLTSLSVYASEIRLSDIERYLNQLDNVESTFEQWDNKGAYTTGTFHLQKPGKLRLSYNKPSKLVIIADGKTLFFIDRKSGDLSYMPINESPASFLVESSIQIQNDFSIKQFSANANKVTLVLKKLGNEDIGTLTLTFARQPKLELIQWVITDPQDRKTIVKLGPFNTFVSKAPDLFNAQPLLN